MSTGDGKGYCSTRVVVGQRIMSRLEGFLRLLAQGRLYGRAISVLATHVQVFLQYSVASTSKAGAESTLQVLQRHTYSACIKFEHCCG